MKSTTVSFSSLLCFLIINASIAGYSHAMAVGGCEYTLNVQTGTEDGAGTDAVITVLLGNARKESIEILNLQQWGVMGSSHDYFENGNLDTFTLKASCIRESLCSIVVMSSGSGYYPGWYLDYIEVTTSSGQTSNFEFDRWLAINEPPGSLVAIIDNCDDSIGREKLGESWVRKL